MPLYLHKLTPTPAAAAGDPEISGGLANVYEPTADSGQNKNAYAILRALNEFSLVPDSEIKQLAGFCRLAAIDAGQFITIEGEEESLNGFIVTSGRFAMLKTSPSGKELIVELLQTGDCFGLLLALAAEKLPSQLSARAIQDSKVLWMPIRHFLQLLKDRPILFKDLSAHLVLCLQSSYRLSRGLAHDRVEVRIAAVLSSLALKFANQAPPDKPLTIAFTRQQLADLTGTTPETAIRVTRAMQRDGIIDISRPGIIRIVNLDALGELAEVG